MDVYNLLEQIAEQLQGKRAFVQIQVENEYYTKRIGDLNDLIDHPNVICQETTANFIDWMEAQWQQKDMKYRTRLNHRSAIRLLRKFSSNFTFADLTHETILNFDRWLVERIKRLFCGKLLT